MDRRGKQGEEYLDAPHGDPKSNPDSRAKPATVLQAISRIIHVRTRFTPKLGILASV